MTKIYPLKRSATSLEAISTSNFKELTRYNNSLEKIDKKSYKNHGNKLVKM